MKKIISSYITLSVILLFVVALSLFFWEKAARATELIKVPQVKSAFSEKTAISSDIPSSICMAHIYEGTIDIKVWYVDQDGEKFLRIADDDLTKLPGYDTSQKFKDKYSLIKLVDADKKLKKKLNNASEKRPKTITIQGYATRCTSVALVCLNYQEDVFQKFLSL